MKVKITDWKLLIKLTWKMELWYQDNYRRLSNKRRKEFRKLMDKMTYESLRLKKELLGDGK